MQACGDGTSVFRRRKTRHWQVDVNLIDLWLHVPSIVMGIGLYGQDMAELLVRYTHE